MAVWVNLNGVKMINFILLNSTLELSFVREFMKDSVHIQYVGPPNLDNIPYLTQPTALLESHALSRCVGQGDAVLDGGYLGREPVIVATVWRCCYNSPIVKIFDGNSNALTWSESPSLRDSADLVVYSSLLRWIWQRKCPTLMIEVDEFLFRNCVNLVIGLTGLSHQARSSQVPHDNSVPKLDRDNAFLDLNLDDEWLAALADHLEGIGSCGCGGCVRDRVHRNTGVNSEALIYPINLTTFINHGLEVRPSDPRHECRRPPLLVEDLLLHLRTTLRIAALHKGSENSNL